MYNSCIECVVCTVTIIERPTDVFYLYVLHVRPAPPNQRARTFLIVRIRPRDSTTSRNVSRQKWCRKNVIILMRWYRVVHTSLYLPIQSERTVVRRSEDKKSRQKIFSKEKTSENKSCLKNYSLITYFVLYCNTLYRYLHNVDVFRVGAFYSDFQSARGQFAKDIPIASRRYD